MSRTTISTIGIAIKRKAQGPVDCHIIYGNSDYKFVQFKWLKAFGGTTKMKYIHTFDRSFLFQRNSKHFNDS